MKTKGSPPPSRASAASSSRLGSAVQSTASGRASGGVMGPPFQTNGVVAPNASRASRRAMERRYDGTTAKLARQTGGSGRPVSSTGGMPTTRARRACRSRKSPSKAGFQLNTMRRASRVSPSTVSSTAAPSPSARASGHASTTVVTASSLSAARSSSAARSLGAPASMSTERSFKTRPVRPRPVTAWMERSSGAAATHSAALASSAHTTSTRGPTPGPCPGPSGPSSSHRSRACSTVGGRTSTTGRPRSSAAFASASVTRSSVVKGRSVGRDGSAWWRERQRRLGSGCVPLAVRAILPPMTPGSGLSPNLHHLETSATIAISQEAKRRKAAGEDVIDLGAGEPDFPTPSLPSDAGVRAIREGKTHYPANEGILELRAAAAKHLSLLSGGRPVNADNIVVSNGSKQSLFNVCFTLFGPGDVVAIPAPAWVSYPQIVYLSRARPVLVPGEPEWSLKVSVGDRARARARPGGQGDGGAPVAHHHGRESSRPVRRRRRAGRRSGGTGRRPDAGRVPQTARCRGRALPTGAPRGRVRGTARRVLLLLPRGLLRSNQRDGVLHPARDHHRGGARAGRRVRRRSLRAIIVCGLSGQHPEGAR